MKLNSAHYVWLQPDKSQRHFSLEGVEAGLRWNPEEPQSAVGNFEAQRWMFEVGFSSDLSASVTDSENQRLGSITKSSDNRYLLSLTDAFEFEWVSNVWNAEWRWLSMSGKDLLTMRRKFSSGPREGEVTLAAEAGATPHIELLVVFGWFLVIAAEDQARSR